MERSERSCKKCQVDQTLASVSLLHPRAWIDKPQMRVHIDMHELPWKYFFRHDRCIF